MGSEFVKELSEMLSVISEFEDDEETEGDIKDFDFDMGGRLNQTITLTDCGGDGEGSHDLVKGGDRPGVAGRAQPKGGSGKQKRQLKEFNDAVLGWEDRALGEPCREKNGNGTNDNQNGCHKTLFPGFVVGVHLIDF